jgi:signal transduction histidine kinase
MKMGLRIRHISTRFALILAAAAAVPLIAYGVASIRSLQRGTHDSIVNGNLNVATRAAEEIRRYVTTDAELLKAVAADLQDTGLQTWQQERILRNDVLQFREFHEITLFDEAGKPIATSRAGQPHVAIPAEGSAAVTFDTVQMSPIHVDADLLPTAGFAIHLKRLNVPDGWLVGEFSLEEMWRMVDAIRIPVHGYALLVGPSGTLIAHGDPDKKALVAQSRNLSGQHPLVGRPADTMPSAEYVDGDGRRQLAVSAHIPQLGWTVIVEQPTDEAYAAADTLQRQLVVAIAIALLAMIVAGLFFGRRFIAPIFALQRGTQLIADGRLDTRVNIESDDEFARLGEAFNTMANRLVELQEDVKRQERHAMFGRIAGGLVHDLNSPLQAIGQSAQALVHPELGADPEFRQETRRTLEKHLAFVKRLMDDVRHVAKPRPLARTAVDVSGSVKDVVKGMRVQAEETNVAIEERYAAEPLIIDVDRLALERVYWNLLGNAVQAMPGGGRLTVSTSRAGHQVSITIADTGCGIEAERLPTIFDDFVTTKRHGLGLGLAVSKRLVEALDGTIGVESEVGRGTSFTLRFPARNDSIQAEAS